jgi:hypothetical protein
MPLKRIRSRRGADAARLCLNSRRGGLASRSSADELMRCPEKGRRSNDLRAHQRRRRRNPQNLRQNRMRKLPHLRRICVKLKTERSRSAGAREPACGIGRRVWKLQRRRLWRLLPSSRGERKLTHSALARRREAPPPRAAGAGKKFSFRFSAICRRISGEPLISTTPASLSRRRCIAAKPPQTDFTFTDRRTNTTATCGGVRRLHSRYDTRHDTRHDICTANPYSPISTEVSRGQEATRLQRSKLRHSIRRRKTTHSRAAEPPRSERSQTS